MTLSFLVSCLCLPCSWITPQSFRVCWRGSPGLCACRASSSSDGFHPHHQITCLSCILHVRLREGVDLFSVLARKWYSCRWNPTHFSASHREEGFPTPLVIVIVVVSCPESHVRPSPLPHQSGLQSPSGVDCRLTSEAFPVSWLLL